MAAVMWGYWEPEDGTIETYGFLQGAMIIPYFDTSAFPWTAPWSGDLLWSGSIHAWSI